LTHEINLFANAKVTNAHPGEALYFVNPDGPAEHNHNIFQLADGSTLLSGTCNVDPGNLIVEIVPGSTRLLTDEDIGTLYYACTRGGGIHCKALEAGGWGMFAIVHVTAVATPAPTAAPTGAPTPGPTSEPTSAPTPGPSGTDNAGRDAGIAVGVVGFLGLLWFARKPIGSWFGIGGGGIGGGGMHERAKLVASYVPSADGKLRMC